LPLARARTQKALNLPNCLYIKKSCNFFQSYGKTSAEQMPPRTESAQEPSLEELQKPTVEVSDSAEPTKEDSDTVESSTGQPEIIHFGLKIS
jgi:hypothetical protein